MASTAVASSGPRATAGRNAFLASAPALNVTTLVSISGVVIFAIVTQLLAASGAISLSTTLQLTMWLVALGFVVLLAIAYMFFRVFERAYETEMSSQDDPAWNTKRVPTDVPALDASGQRDETYETQAPVAQEHNDVQEPAPVGQDGQDGRSPRNPTDGARKFVLGWSPDGSTQTAEEAWVPPGEFRHLEGSEYSVSTEEVFPEGCYLEPDSIKPVPGKPADQQVYECRVVDLNQELENRPHDTVVKIRADQEPCLESMPRFGRVEFENLTITPYVTDRDPMSIRYSLRATGLHRAAAPTGRDQTTWTVPPRGVSPEEVDSHAGTDGAPSEAGDTS